MLILVALLYMLYYANTGSIIRPFQDPGTASAAEHILRGPAASAKIEGVLKNARANLAKSTEDGKFSVV